MKAKDVDSYIASFPQATQEKLEEMRRIIKTNAPKAEESISYQMPYYKYKQRLVYFAGYEHHIGLYIVGRVMEEFKKELAEYKTAKATIRFPLDKPLPKVLIKNIIKAAVAEIDRDS